MQALLDHLSFALSGWLWLAPAIVIMVSIAWVCGRLDLGNDARSVFVGHVVHHSIGDKNAAIAIDLSRRQLLLCSAGSIETFPFEALRHARLHRLGSSPEGSHDHFREVYPSRRMLVELTLAGREENAFIEIFNVERHRSAFGRIAARQRAFKWLVRLQDAIWDDRASTWGLSKVSASTASES